MWHNDGDRIEIIPERDSETFYWMDEVSFRLSVDVVTLDPLTSVAEVNFEGDTFEQQWRRGFVCLDCCAYDGVFACALPFDQLWSYIDESLL